MSTLAYGTGTGYALGAANTITTVNYENSIQKKTTLTTNAYQWWDGAAQSTITFDSDTASGTNPINTSTYYYANVGGQGQLKSVAVQDGRARTITFRNDSDGAALRRDEADAFTSNGDPHEIWYRFGARQLGYTGNNGTRETDYNASIANRTATPGSGAFFNGSTTSVAQGDFDQSLNPITSYEQGSAGGAYSVREGDTLAGLAERLWGDASLWWKIAEANGLTGQAALVEGQALTLPAGVMRATHNAQTFQPYDPSETIGDTAPTTLQPTPKKNKCGVFGRIFLVVIAVAVAAITKDFLTAGRILSVGAKVAVAAVSGATGSIVSQGVGVATGIQDKFSWNAVALAAIGGGVGASGVGDKFANALGVTSKTGVVAVSGAASSALTQGIGVATGLQDKFDWAGVAAAGAGAYVGAKVGGLLPTNTPPFAANLVASTASALANAATRSLIDGSDFGDNILAALPDVLGQTIGGAFADGISGTSKPKPLTAAKIELFAPMEEETYAPIPELADLPNMPSFTIADNAWRSSTPIADMKQWAERLGGDIEFAQAVDEGWVIEHSLMGASRSDEPPAAFLSSLPDDENIAELSRLGVLAGNASVADLLNLYTDRTALNAAALLANLSEGELGVLVANGARSLEGRASAATEWVLDGGILFAEQRENSLRSYLQLSGLSQMQTNLAFDGLIGLAGYSVDSWADVKLRTALPRALTGIVSGGGLSTIARRIPFGATEAAVARLSATDFPAIAAQISQQRQLRHLPGAAGGYMSNLNDAQAVLDAYHAGDAIILGRSAQGFPVVRVPGVTGINVNRAAGITIQVTNVFMIKGTVRPSVVPLTPTWRPR